ncbi:hypothetical protein BDV93DRAFT_341532 [Ceratobasidium sp. AG-I]|nr:hypothetical protein BDV93DRAFT_341532 [Ceratobasidium sp. AG-I]
MAIICELCDVQSSSPAAHAQHIAGRPHRLKQQSLHVDPLVTQMQDLNLRNQPQAQENVQYAIDFGVVRNTESGPNALSTDIVFSPPAPDSTRLSDQRITASIQPIKSSRTNSVQGFQIQSQNMVSPGRFRVFVRFNPQSLQQGVHVVQLRLEYLSGDFRDVRWLKVKGIVGAPEDHDELKPIAPFEGLTKLDANDWHRGKMVRGKQAVKTLDFTGLPYYDVPEDYRRTFKNEGKRGGDSIQINLQSLLPTDLNSQTYKNRWTHLLWHEELQMEVELKAYDMNGVTINRVQGHDYSYVIYGVLERLLC